MKKTISITLAGIIFNIEEDGYNKLKTYLDSIREYFAQRNENAEIMDDIEARAAEKFSEQVSSSKQAITLADVEELIASMGTIEDIAGEERSENMETKTEAQKPKKLYRDPDNAIIMGVCAGIANYFGIDPVLVRIVFLLTLFFGGSGILIYIILCFIVPEAKTTAQKMEMHGQPVNLTSLRAAAEEKIGTARKNISGQPARKLVLTSRRLAKKMFRILSMIFGVFLIAGSAAALLGMSIFIGNLLFNANTVLLNFPEKELLPGIQYYLALAAVFFTALIPILFLMLIGLSLIRRRLIWNLASGLILLFVWIFSVAALGVLGVRMAANHEERIRSIEESPAVSKTYDLRDFDSISADGNYTINVEKGDDYGISVEAREADFGKIEVSQNSNTLRIDEDHRGICIFCSDLREAKTVTITMPALRKFTSDGKTQSDIRGFDTGDLDFDLDGIGSTKANVQAADVSVEMDGASKLILSGKAGNLAAKVEGIAKLDSTALEASAVTLNTDGSSSASVWATDKLDARAKGVSKIYYKGEPEITEKIFQPAHFEKYQD